MRSSLLGIAVAAAGILVLVTAVVSLGEDYLVIKKKDGTTQKVPLNFLPEDIESFSVQPSPTRRAPAGEEAPGGRPPRETGAEEPEAKALKIKPGGPPSGAMIPERRREEAVPFSRDPDKARPPETRGPVTEKAEPAGPRTVERAPVSKRPVSGPVSGPSAGGRAGAFTVNIYKLPENVKALPDFSAFRPEKVVGSSEINLRPAKGDLQPAGVPEPADGLGLRFIGIFRVSGEGIFRWRTYSKDGVRLHVDDKTLIENDGIHDPSSKTGFVHLAEGTHSIILDSFNSKGNPVLQLFVTPPIGGEEIFSIRKGLTGWKQPGKPYDVLWGQVYFVPKGKYPKGPDYSRISPIGRLIAPELSISGGEGFAGLPGRKDMVGIRYEGFFNVEGAGIFAFRLRTDKFAELRIGKHKIMEITGGLKSHPEGKIGWAFLQKGSYPVSVDYFHPKGDPILQLYVTQPTKEEQLFSPARTVEGYASGSGKMNLIPAFVYFLKPKTTKIPNFNKLTPSGMFFTKSIDYPVDRGTTEFPGIPRRNNWVGIRFYVKFSLSEGEQGEYKFRIVADDGARLIVGKKLVVNAAGYGKTTEKTGIVTLKAGSHEMFLDYFQAKGPTGVQLFITAPGGEEKVFAFQ